LTISCGVDDFAECHRREFQSSFQNATRESVKNLLMNSTAEKIVLLSHKFFAHAATEDSRVALAFSGIKLTDADEVQRAFVRVERAITDLLLFIAIARQVVPMPPLWLLNGLEHPYALTEAIKRMN
jgi:hypothetical protein